MKKLILTLIFIAASIGCMAHTDWEGSWKTGKVVYTFACDTLYIDELGNEGDWYRFNFSGDTIVAKNEFATVRMIVKQKTPKTIQVKVFDGRKFKKFNMKRIEKYNFWFTQYGKIY